MKNLKNNIVEMENDFGDTYIKEDGDFGGSTKKANMSYWDDIDGSAQTAVEEIAKMVGITEIEWEDYSLIKEVVELITKSIEDRFDVKFKYIDEE